MQQGCTWRWCQKFKGNVSCNAHDSFMTYASCADCMQASSHAGKGLARRRSSGTLGLFAPMPGVYWPQANPPGYMQQPNALPRGMFTALLNSALQPANAAVSTGPVHCQPWLSADVGHVAQHCMEQTGRPKQLQHCAQPCRHSWRTGWLRSCA